MNEFIKKIFNSICWFLTWVINQGLVLMCFKESHSLWKLPENGVSKEMKVEFKVNRAFLKKYGFRELKRDFYLFRNYFVEKGNDPKFIVPAYVVHRYLTSILNPIPYSAYFEDKNMLDKILPSDCQPKTFFRRMEGCWYDAQYNPVCFTEIKSFMTNGCLIPSIIVKPSRDSSSGKGIMLFKNNKGNWQTIDGENDFFQLIDENHWNNSDLIIQEVIEQHEFLRRLCPTSVNSLRLVIYNSPVDSDVSLIWSGLKIGAMGSVVDNNHAGGLMFGVGNDGTIASYGADLHGNKYHVFNGIDFSRESLIVPGFKEIVEFAKSRAKCFLPCRFLAFDIAVDKDGKPIVIECNMRSYGGWACQFAGDPMLGDKSEEILSYLSSHKNKGCKVFYKII